MAESATLVRSAETPALVLPQKLGDITAWAKALSSAKNPVQDNIIVISVGLTYGLMPAVSVKSIWLIQGSPVFHYSILASRIRQSPYYDYRVPELSDQKVTIEILDKKTREVIGTTSFTAEMARKAETKNMVKWAPNMLFARAMANAVRFFCPDVMHGAFIIQEEISSPEDAKASTAARIREHMVSKGHTEPIIDAEIVEEPEEPRGSPSEAVYDEMIAEGHAAMKADEATPSIAEQISKAEAALEKARKAGAKRAAADIAATPEDADAHLQDVPMIETVEEDINELL